MLATFVIGLREGLEASLIVGIIAAFLRQQGRPALVRQVLIGVVLAVLICIGAGVGLTAMNAELPQRQQEAMETVIGLFAVAMVTYMIVWMTRHGAGLKRQLETSAADAVATGSAGALVVMAFLAVLREGLERVVFLIATFNASTSAAAAAAGAVLGVVAAVGVGYAIYRGGLRLNMARFFRATGAVLVLVAAGLLATAAHTAHEAGFIDFGQAPVGNLAWLVRPGTPWSSLLTGMLGIQPRPVFVEAVLWVGYLVPMLTFVLMPRKQLAVVTR
jgi:high-affinity iron transporter